MRCPSLGSRIVSRKLSIGVNLLDSTPLGIILTSFVTVCDSVFPRKFEDGVEGKWRTNVQKDRKKCKSRVHTLR